MTYNEALSFAIDNMDVIGKQAQPPFDPKITFLFVCLPDEIPDLATRATQDAGNLPPIVVVKNSPQNSYDVYIFSNHHRFTNYLGTLTGFLKRC
ncbi:hypothetical protein [Foetidibacter luteolus]|uniref:hypothetical protein n=1 Tax=Foetidibacter luteolus TaxID=2608880 RepID=UPI00129AFA2E|nr:hypothetical protein [Foetidibacter luteolus]